MSELNTRRMRYAVGNRSKAFFDAKLKSGLRRLLFRSTNTPGQPSPIRVCVPIAAFPFPGGMRSVLAGVVQVMSDQWQMTYLTHRKGQPAEGLEIEIFGLSGMYPWRFPNIWFYCVAGWLKLFALLHSGPGYDLILPQDGVFSGAFAALVGKMAGVHVVCMDHGNIACLESRTLRMEWIKEIQGYPWYRQVFSWLGYASYWPSLRLLARIATRCADRFLVAGDEVEEVYRKHLGVHPDRIVRYAYTVDAARFTPLDQDSRTRKREEQDIPAEAIVITMINRLATEKGLEFALEGIAWALAALPPELCSRVRVLIAGDGPLRSQVEADIQRLNLNSACALWGEAKPSDVVMLLGISDIFLYSGTRGTNYSMAVLEAMAAGCAVVASVVPQSNARLLAEGRGIAIRPGDATEIGTALARLCESPELCHQMGQKAREYVTIYHSAQELKRNLLNASSFALP